MDSIKVMKKVKILQAEGCIEADKDKLMVEYDFTEEEAEAVNRILKDLQKEELEKLGKAGEIWLGFVRYYKEHDVDQLFFFISDQDDLEEKARDYTRVVWDTHTQLSDGYEDEEGDKEEIPSIDVDVISKAKCLSKEDVIAFMVTQLIDEDNGIWDKHAYKETVGYTDIIQIAEEFPDLDRMGRKLDIYNYKHLPPA